MPSAIRMSCWHRYRASIGMALPATISKVRIGAMRSRSQVPHQCSREEREPRRRGPHEREQRGEYGDRVSGPADERVDKSRW